MWTGYLPPLGPKLAYTFRDRKLNRKLQQLKDRGDDPNMRTQDLTAHISVGASKEVVGLGEGG